MKGNRLAEESVLGALLMAHSLGEKGKRLAEDVFFELRSHHFFGTVNGRPGRNALVYEACRSVHEAGKPLDVLQVTEALRAAGTLEKAGGTERLTELATLVPAVSNVVHHARLVIDSSRRYRLWQMQAENMKLIEEGAAPQQALDAIEHRIVELRSQIERGRSTVFSAQDLAAQFAEKAAAPPSLGEGVTTPFPTLGPMMPGRLYVLGGYQADGKTALALQFLLHAAKDGTKKVGFVSVEMSVADVRDRLVAAFGVPYREAISGRVKPEHKEQADRALQALSTVRFDVIDDEAVDVPGIRRYARLGGYDALIVDHLHRLDWTERRELERNVRGLTNLARESSIPILLLAQLHRRGDEFPRPTMASLRESGMIEAEASCVWFVWRKRDEAKLPTEEAEFIVAKNRFGPTGKFALRFDAERVRFTEPVTERRAA